MKTKGKAVPALRRQAAGSLMGLPSIRGWLLGFAKARARLLLGVPAAPTGLMAPLSNRAAGFVSQRGSTQTLRQIDGALRRQGPGRARRLSELSAAEAVTLGADLRLVTALIAALDDPKIGEPVEELLRVSANRNPSCVPLLEPLRGSPSGDARRLRLIGALDPARGIELARQLLATTKKPKAPLLPAIYEALATDPDALPTLLEGARRGAEPARAAALAALATRAEPQAKAEISAQLKTAGGSMRMQSALPRLRPAAQAELRASLLKAARSEPMDSEWSPTELSEALASCPASEENTAALLAAAEAAQLSPRALSKLRDISGPEALVRLIALPLRRRLHAAFGGPRPETRALLFAAAARLPAAEVYAQLADTAGEDLELQSALCMWSDRARWRSGVTATLAPPPGSWHAPQLPVPAGYGETVPDGLCWDPRWLRLGVTRNLPFIVAALIHEEAPERAEAVEVLKAALQEAPVDQLPWLLRGLDYVQAILPVSERLKLVDRMWQRQSSLGPVIDALLSTLGPEDLSELQAFARLRLRLPSRRLSRRLADLSGI